MPSFLVKARYLNDTVEFVLDAMDTKGALEAARKQAMHIFSFTPAPGVNEPTVYVKPVVEKD